MKKHKLLLYTPGMISLIVLPVLLFPFLSVVTPFGNVRVLQIIAVREKPPERNYLDILLTGDEYNDKIKLDFAQIMMKEIEANQDTLRGIHYKFAPACKYKSLVRIISNTELLSQPYYLFNGHELWGFYFRPPEPAQNSLICGTQWLRAVPHRSTSIVNIQHFLSTEKLLILISVFAVLIIATFLKSRKMEYE